MDKGSHTLVKVEVIYLPLSLWEKLKKTASDLDGHLGKR